MASKVHIVSSALAIVQGVNTGAVVSFEKPKRATGVTTKDDSTSKSPISPWGDGNDFPQLVIKDVEADHELGQMLSTNATLIYSGGLAWGIPKMENGIEKLIPLDQDDNDKVQDWLEKSNINQYLIEAAIDLEYFANAFVEMILRKDRKEIIQICVQAAENCRFEKMVSGQIKKCRINANWPDVADKDDKLTTTLDVLDPYYDPAKTLAEFKSGFNFIFPIFYPSPGKNYYQLAKWNGIREGDWLPLSKAIPASKLAYLTNQLNIKYHVEISDLYWEIKYSNFKALKKEEQQKLVDAELDAFAKILSGVEKTGNSLITVMKTDPILGKEYSLWKITPIANPVKKGEFIEEMKEATAAKLAAVGLHPALLGTLPNNGMGGAGSNIREAYNLNNIKNRSKQDILLSPLRVVRDYNGWPKNMVFRIMNPFMTTLDKGTETTTNPK